MGGLRCFEVESKTERRVSRRKSPQRYAEVGWGGFGGFWEGVAGAETQISPLRSEMTKRGVSAGEKQIFPLRCAMEKARNGGWQEVEGYSYCDNALKFESLEFRAFQLRVRHSIAIGNIVTPR